MTREFLVDKTLLTGVVEYECDDVDKQTVYNATLKLPDGRTHNITHNFGYGYPVDSAEFMFEEGNYSGDCNKPLVLQQQGFDIDAQPCGDEIEILSYNITLEG